MTDGRVKTTQGRAKLAARLRHLGGLGAAPRRGARLAGASVAGHEVHTDIPHAAGRCVRGLLVATLVVAALGAFATSSAYAGGLENFCGSTLLEKGHFCHSEFGGSEVYTFLISGENLTNSNPVCVGPVAWNGKEYSYPYGWSCGTGLYTWEFTPIASVAGGVENPNSPPEKINGGLLWSYLPAETTGSATGITSEKATLNGTVSAKGSATHYWFEYGKTTSYGSSTATEYAGFAENDAVSATTSSLEADATYHYRLVAKNRAGTTYGSDKTFVAEDHAPSAFAQSNGEIQAFYRGSNGAVWDDWLDTKGTWHVQEIGGSPAGNPSAFVQSNGQIQVFYRGSNGAIWDDWLDTKGTWHVQEIGGAAAGAPSAFVQSNGEIQVFYRGSNGAVWDDWLDTKGTWHVQEIGGSPAGNPSAFVQSNGQIQVFYRGSNGAVWDDWLDTKGTWHVQEIGGAAAGAPSAFVQSNGEIQVFYRGSNGAIWDDWLDTKAMWHIQEIGGSIE